MAANRFMTQGIALALLIAAWVPTAPAAEPRAAAKYPHRTVKKYEIGEGPRSYILFEPADPKPDLAPIVVFNHGWLAMNPGVYGAWIDHLVRSGNVVIYPRFMETETPVNHYLPNALDALVDAFQVLTSSPAHVKGDLQRFALVGHSTGGVLAAQLAALVTSRGLPEPRAVVAVTPGEILRTRSPDLGRIPASTLLVVITAEHDVVTGNGQARKIYRESTAIPDSRKKYVLFRTDMRGKPAFWADHLAPTASSTAFDNGEGPFHDFQMIQGATNAIDRNGFWRVADLTLAAGFSSKTLDQAFDGGKALLSMGYWSDGRPVIPPIVTNDPGKLPRVVPTHGFRLIPWPSIEIPRK